MAVKNIFGDNQIKVVRHIGDLHSAYLQEDGTTVNRANSIYIRDIGTVNCAPYDNHFVFRHVYVKNGEAVRGWTLWCTCGSPAAVVGYDAYKKEASNQGSLVVCLRHAESGKHADGSS